MLQVPTMRATNKVLYAFAERRLLDHKATFEEGHIRDLADLHLKQRKQWNDDKLKTGVY